MTASLLKKEIAKVRPGLRGMATRLEQGEADFLDVLQAAGKLSRSDAIRVLHVYRKLKVVKRYATTGEIRVKHGAFLDGPVIRRALEES